MSRSYKKNPVCKDSAHKDNKRWANKRIRKFIKSVKQGFKSMGFFHKLYNSYDLSDHKATPWTKNHKNPIPWTEEDIQKAKRK